MIKCLLTDGKGIDSLIISERPATKGLSPGHVLVEVHAVSLNYRDLMVARGDYGGEYDPPIIAGTDFAGIVLETASDVKTFKAGDKVLNHPFLFWPSGKLNSNWIRTMIGGLGKDGILIEQIAYPAEALVPIPEHMSFEEASTLPIAGLTAWSAIVTHGHARPGEWVLVHGTGGVSIFGAQIAKILGARVILTTSNDKKAETVKQKLGVDIILNYKDADWPKQVKKITNGDGVDVVVEIAGGESLTNSLAAAGYNSRVAIIGNLADRTAALKLFDIVRRQITLRGIFMESCEVLKEFARACESSGLQPWIDKVFPFEDSVIAYRHLESQKHIGKVVIKFK